MSTWLKKNTNYLYNNNKEFYDLIYYLFNKKYLEKNIPNIYKKKIQKWSIKSDIKEIEYRDNQKISVLASSRFTKEQIKRLKHLIKMQCNNVISKRYKTPIMKIEYISYNLTSLYNLVKSKKQKNKNFLPSLSVSNLYDTPTSSYDNFLKFFLKFLPKKGRRMYDPFGQTRNKYKFAMFKDISDDFYAHNCASAILSIFPKLIRSVSPIVTPGTIRPIHDYYKSLPKFYKNKSFQSKQASNNFYENNTTDLKIKLHNINFDYNFTNKKFKNKQKVYSKNIFQIIELYKRLFNNFYNNLIKLNKQLKTFTSNTDLVFDDYEISKIKMIGNFIFNFKIEYFKNSNDNRLRELRDNLVYIKSLIFLLKQKYKKYRESSKTSWFKKQKEIQNKYYKFIEKVEDLFDLNNRLLENIQTKLENKEIIFKNDVLFNVILDWKDVYEPKKDDINIQKFKNENKNILKLSKGDKVVVFNSSKKSNNEWWLGHKFGNMNKIGYFKKKQIFTQEKLINNNNNVLSEVIYRRTINEVNKNTKEVKQRKIERKHKIVNKNKLNTKLLELLTDLQKLLKEKSNSAKTLNFSYNSLSNQVRKIVEKMKKGNLNKTKIKNVKLIQLLNKIKDRTIKSIKRHTDNKITPILKKINQKLNLINKMLIKYQLI